MYVYVCEREKKGEGSMTSEEKCLIFVSPLLSSSSWKSVCLEDPRGTEMAKGAK